MNKCNASPTLTASGQVVVGSEHVYHGYTVTVVTATGAINIRMGSSSGQIVDVIPAATAVGAHRGIVVGPQMRGGIYVEFAGGATGSVVVLYE